MRSERRVNLRWLGGPVLALAFAGNAAWAQPVLDSLDSDSLARSGRLVLTGSGFGGGGSGGRVEVDGLASWTTTWTDSRIVAFAPEGAPLGSTTVRVVAGGQSSNELPLDVTHRTGDGRVKWTFEADSDNQWFRPALAPDGTVDTQNVIAVLNAWAAGESSADFNGDGAVNTLDVLAFLNAWSSGC